VALLEVEGLRAGYERLPVIFGVHLEVGEGEVVALLGLNGAGKTTTLRAISGMIPVMGGKVRFDGDDITGLPAEQIARRGLLHIPEGRGIFPSLRVDESLRLAAAMARVPAAESRSRLEQIHETFPRLAERGSQPAGTLSGGEQQMLALARALMWRPRLMLIDEMSQGLAPTVVNRLMETVADFKAAGTAIVLVEQFVAQALEVADRAYVIEKGEVAYSGSAAALAADESFVKGSYLGDASLEQAAVAGDGLRVTALAEMSVSLPPALIRGLVERAGQEGRDVEELIQEALADLLDDRGNLEGHRGSP
jgi:branched-chain amino acid transport system ATP-binding protein